MSTVRLRPYAAYRDSGVLWLGQVPAHWEVRRAKHYLHEVDERSTTGEEERLSVSHITGVTPRSQKNITMFEAESYVGHKLCQPGDVVANTLWTWMGAIGVSQHRGIVSPAYGVYRPRTVGHLEPRYLDSLLRVPALVGEYVRRSTGIRGSRLRLYANKLLDIPLPCPPTDEQRRIADFIDVVDRLVRRHRIGKRRMLALLRKKRGAELELVLTRGLDAASELRDTGVPWLGRVPSHWQVDKLKRFASFAPSRSEIGKDFRFDCPVTFLPMERIGTDGAVDTAEQRQIGDVWEGYTYFRRGDVVIAKITPCFENGKGAWLGNLPTEFGFGTTELIVLRAGPKLDAEFLRLITAMPSFRTLGEEAMTGAAGQQRIPTRFVRDFLVAVPPLQEQRAIVAAVDRASKVDADSVQRIHQELGLVKEFGARLISDLVTGRQRLDLLGDALAGAFGDAGDLPESDEEFEEVSESSFEEADEEMEVEA